MEIMKMSAREVLLIDEFTKLAKEAIKAEQIIMKNFGNSFDAGKQTIKVYHCERFGDYYCECYLSIDGTFECKDNMDGGRVYKFRCDADGIYKMLRSCYLERNNMSKLDPEAIDCKIAYADQVFREFISQLEAHESK